MANGRTLQLEATHDLHQRLTLRAFLQATVLRLSLHPVTLPEDARQRVIQVDHRGNESDWTIQWLDSTDYSRAQLELFSNAYNDGDITEQAAVGMMAALIHALEGTEIRGVSQIGTGGDYVLQLPGATTNVLVECSGILQDRTGSETRRRLKDKGWQVLRKRRTGFASVTTFDYGSEQVVRSILHFFEKSDLSMINRPVKRKPGR